MKKDRVVVKANDKVTNNMARLQCVRCGKTRQHNSYRKGYRCTGCGMERGL